MSTIYPFDSTGTAVSNLVGGTVHEQYQVSATTNPNGNYIIATNGPFYYGVDSNHMAKVFKIQAGVSTQLVEGVDFVFCLRFIDATYALGTPIYGGVSLLNNSYSGTIGLQYQAIGGTWIQTNITNLYNLVNELYAPRTVAWDQITGEVPGAFPPGPHAQDISSSIGQFTDLITAINTLSANIQSAIANPVSVAAELSSHIASTNTAAHQPSNVGLGLVQNFAIAQTSDATAGTATNLYMTPATTKAAIGAINSASASKLNQIVTITLTGDVTGAVSTNFGPGTGGSYNYTLAATLAKITPPTGTVGNFALGSISGYNISIGASAPVSPTPNTLWLVPGA